MSRSHRFVNLSVGHILPLAMAMVAGEKACCDIVSRLN